MALPPLIRQLVDKKLNKYCEQKIPPHVRDKIKIHYKIRGNSVTLLESRPYWRDNKIWTELAVAQFRFDLKVNKWSLYCADRNNKWHLYTNIESKSNLDDILKEVDKDPIGIFWG